MPAVTPAIHGARVEDAILATLARWMPTYLAELAADRDLPRSTYTVASYARSATVDTRFPEQALPCVVVNATSKTSNGLESDGTIGAWFEVAIGVLVADQHRGSSRDVAWDYATAIESILIQQPALDGFAAATQWTGTSPEDIEVKSRTLAGAIVEALVLVDPVLNAFDGPAEPSEDPTDPLPADQTVATVDIDVAPTD